MDELKTSAQWAEHLGAKILDHDGWRFDLADCDFDKDLITKADFDRRLQRCTIDFRGYPNFVKI
jgi:hypothetical protein